MNFNELATRLKEITEQTNEQNLERIRKSSTKDLVIALENISWKYLQASDSIFKECCLEIKNEIEEELKIRGDL